MKDTPTGDSTGSMPSSLQVGGIAVCDSAPEIDPGDQKPLDSLSHSFGLVLAQPTTRCNIDCAYCYLPGRDRRNRMSVEVAEAIAQGISVQDGRPVTVGWHAGEPLATGRSHFERLLAPFEELRDSGVIAHAVQTNATLINDGWCDLFAEYGVAVGVSIDGPGQLNSARRDWEGRDTYDRAMRGIALLNSHEIPVTVLTVVSAATVDRASEVLGFLGELGTAAVGFIFEERDNANLDRGRPTITFEQAVAFWREVIAYLRANPGLRVREIADLARFLKHQEPALPVEPLPTVAYNGDVVVTGPELAGAPAPEHGNFVVGNVLTTPLPTIMEQIRNVDYVRRFATGLVNCRNRCSFWEYCGGGCTASKRWFEHGAFEATETTFCRNRIQAPVTALLSVMDEEGLHSDTRSGTRDELRRIAGAGRIADAPNPQRRAAPAEPSRPH
ncbi:cyclophane-forming radical SAM peptide maturase AmcB [Plantactinospora sp. CA-290183]|uniref:cyclophane-forming radical SAM peptide maturase AmcB n=1 Tax=Plantactinospora sp. CA-290183 TaxID=3240006 RepID=UPI003D9469E6